MSIMKYQDHIWNLHWWLQNEGESGGSSSHQPPFPKWGDNLSPTVQETTIQQPYLCCWGYSHQPGTEQLPAHGFTLSPCSSLLWLNVLFVGDGGEDTENLIICHIMNLLVIEWHKHTCSFLLDTKPLWHCGKRSGPASKRPLTLTQAHWQVSTMQIWSCWLTHICSSWFKSSGM